MKRLFIVYISLVVLTLSGTFISKMQAGNAWIPIVLILALLCVKYITVVLEYMEMRKSNPVWKFSVIMPAVVVALIIGIFTISI